MDVIQVLEGRDASVNSLFHLGVQFLQLGLRESDEICAFFSVPRTDPACASLCLSSGITSSRSSSFSTPQCSCGAFIRFRLGQNPPLEAGPCCDSRSPSRRSWVFSQDSKDCERLMKRKTPLPRERGANTLCCLPLKAGPVVSNAVFLFFYVIWITISLQTLAIVGSAELAF